MRRVRVMLIAATLGAILSAPALAHTGESGGGFVSGLAHPVFGPDHVVAMVAVETAIATSAIVLGMMVALAARPPLWVAAVVVGVFAVFHGYAHGKELPDGANAVAFSAGFVIATGLLHLCGIAFGLLTRWPAGRYAVRAAGGVIALVGVAYLGGFG